MKSTYMLLCVFLPVVGVVPLAGGVGAGAFVPLVVCMLMTGGDDAARPRRPQRRAATAEKGTEMISTARLLEAGSPDAARGSLLSVPGSMRATNRVSAAVSRTHTG